MKRIVCVLALSGLVAGACTVDRPDSPRGDPDGSNVRSASDRGVTADEITLGVLAMRQDAFSRFGVTLPGRTPEQILAPFVDEVNRNGGVNGRKLVTKVSLYSPLSQDDMQAACVEQAEDHEVFAAISPPGFWGDAQICLASKRVPLLAADASTLDALHRRAEGWIRQTVMSKDRMVRTWIDWLIDQGTLTSTTKTGVIYTEVPEDRQLVNDVIFPYLRERGMQPPELGTFTLGTPETAAMEAGTSVLRFKRAEVELVLPVTNFLQMFLWARNAENNDYRPTYSVSDIGLLASDITGFYPAEQWNGVTGLTAFRTGEAVPGATPDNPAFVECLDIYRQAGLDLPNVGESPLAALEVVWMIFYCSHIRLFVEAATGAGTNPTGETYLRAFDGIEDWTERVTMTERLTFGPDKYDGADLVATVRWQSPCGSSQGGCYQRVEDFRSGTGRP